MDSCKTSQSNSESQIGLMQNLSVQFSIQNWTHTNAAYRIHEPNLYASSGPVQFSIVNWTEQIGRVQF